MPTPPLHLDSKIPCLRVYLQTGYVTIPYETIEQCVEGMRMCLDELRKSPNDRAKCWVVARSVVVPKVTNEGVENVTHEVPCYAIDYRVIHAVRMLFVVPTNVDVPEQDEEDVR